jgi:hypothetical protein
MEGSFLAEGAFLFRRQLESQNEGCGGKGGEEAAEN